MSEKSVFREAWSPEMTSQSFPVSCFWSRGFVSHRKWHLTLLVHQNMELEKENRYRKIFLLYLSVHWADLIEQIKKKTVIYTLRTWFLFSLLFESGKERDKNKKKQNKKLTKYLRTIFTERLHFSQHILTYFIDS